QNLQNQSHRLKVIRSGTVKTRTNQPEANHCHRDAFASKIRQICRNWRRTENRPKNPTSLQNAKNSLGIHLRLIKSKFLQPETMIPGAGTGTLEKLPAVDLPFRLRPQSSAGDVSENGRTSRFRRLPSP